MVNKYISENISRYSVYPKGFPKVQNRLEIETRVSKKIYSISGLKCCVD